MASSGVALAITATGAIFVWAGIKGYSVTSTIQDVVTGKNPNAQAQTNSIPLTETAQTAATLQGGLGSLNASSNTAAQNQALAKQIAIQLGHADWTTGAEWDSWLSLWNQESSWMDEANPHSSARGIAQNIQGYGPDYQQGNMPQQITWGINYIAGRYGDPIAAWEHEKANNWY